MIESSSDSSAVVATPPLSSPRLGSQQKWKGCGFILRFEGRVEGRVQQVFGTFSKKEKYLDFNVNTYFSSCC